MTNGRCSSCWARFDSTVFFNNHKAIQRQMYQPGIIKSKYVLWVFRLFVAVFTFSLMIKRIVEGKWPNDFFYLTLEGFYGTGIVATIGLFVYPEREIDY